MKLTKSLSASKKSADIVPASPEHSLKPLDWKTIMHEWESSGLSQREFCEKKSLAYTSFMYNHRVKPGFMPHFFHTDEHRELFLNLLADIHQRFSIQIHAYCLKKMA